MDNQSPFKSGFVAIVGRPNVGKSTLMNSMLAQKVAAVSPRPQTTRRRQLGILTRQDCQIIFQDTPGLHKPVNKLGEFMNEEAAGVLQDADVLLWLVAASQAPNDEDRLAAARLAEPPHRPPTLLVLNKADQVPPEQREERKAAYIELCPGVEPLWISALHSDGILNLLSRLIEMLPEGPAFYDEDQVTDLYEREIAADLVREAPLLLLREEVPHAIAVRIEEYKERDDGSAYINAALIATRESHKGILIGKGGEMIKRIGSAARKEIEAMSGRKVFLSLRGKVMKDWRDDTHALRALGYSRKTDE